MWRKHPRLCVSVLTLYGLMIQQFLSLDIRRISNCYSSTATASINNHGKSLLIHAFLPQLCGHGFNKLKISMSLMGTESTLSVKTPTLILGEFLPVYERCVIKTYSTINLQTEIFNLYGLLCSFTVTGRRTRR